MHSRCCINRDEAMNSARLFGHLATPQPGRFTDGRTYAAGLGRPAEVKAGFLSVVFYRFFSWLVSHDTVPFKED